MRGIDVSKFSETWKSRSDDAVRERGSEWAIVLAGGDGTRLSSVTKNASGEVVPKQFCSLSGGCSLLEDAILRAESVAPRERIVIVVAEKHRPFWTRILDDHPRENVVVQPSSRGTAPGILLPLLHVLERDPYARVVVLPSDHYVERESVLASSLRDALGALDALRGGIVLLGVSPDTPEPGYGWIVPRPSASLVHPVAQFVEKPERSAALELMARGAVWNSFLIVAAGRSILSAFETRLPRVLEKFRATFAASGQDRAARLRALYFDLESNDFSRDVLEGSEDGLHVLIVPQCGWTDLGTPPRVVACLASLTQRGQLGPERARERSRAMPSLASELGRVASLGV
jgi:mannose-1-phosphate guanylyltransferase